MTNLSTGKAEENTQIKKKTHTHTQTESQHIMPFDA